MTYQATFSPSRKTLAALEDCQDAALGLLPWAAALQNLSDSIGASSCVIRTEATPNPFKRRHDHVYGADSTEHAEFAHLWLERVPHVGDPRLPRRSGRTATGSNVTLEDEVVSTEKRAKHPFYQEVARPGRRDWWAAACFTINRHRWCMSSFRDDRLGRFVPEDKPILAAVVPYLARAIGTGQKALELEAGAMLSALDRIRTAAVLLDDEGEVLAHNAGADALLGNTLTVHGRRLRVANATSDRALQALIGRAVEDTDGRPGMALLHHDGRPWLQVETAPFTRAMHDVFGTGRILVFLSPVSPICIPRPEILAAAFGLSRAEARLAVQLAQGIGLSTAASRLEIHRETAKSQLRTIFEKTATRRQAELAALLTSLGARQNV